MISCAMIAWNEAKTIDLTLKGIAGLVDEVIIADTGSWDGTQNKARRWMRELGLSGEVKSVKVRNLGEARRAAMDSCQHEWILMIDSNLVISRLSHKELKRHVKKGFAVSIKPMNLMGDYAHGFKPLPMLNFHLALFRLDQVFWKFKYDRPSPKRKIKRTKSNSIAANLSRVRPAWRCYIRGEPYDKRYYIHHPKHKRTYKTKSNFQWQWIDSGKYHSPLEYLKAEHNLTLRKIKRVAPKWYLKMLRLHAVPLRRKERRLLPDVIKEELENPRYKLVYEKRKIAGRLPEL